MELGRLGSFVDGYRVWLLERGYSPGTVRHELRFLGVLGRWMAAEDVAVGQLDGDVIAAFVETHRVKGRFAAVVARGSRSLVIYLRELGVVGAERGEPVTPLGELIEQYRQWLVGDRGLAPLTVGRYVALASRFLGERVSAVDELGVKDLDGGHVAAFLLRECERLSVDSAKGKVGELRSLLRFLFVRGLIRLALGDAVPPVASWRDTGIPRAVAPADVERLIVSCDRSTLDGARDAAIVLLLARLGLRSIEVARLELADLDWRAGELLVRGKGGREDRLPLPDVIRSSLGHVVNVVLVLVLVSEATRILSASSTSSLPLLCVIVAGGPRMPGRGAQRRQRPASSECAGYGCRSLAGCRGAWWGRIGRSLSRSSVTWRG